MEVYIYNEKLKGSVLRHFESHVNKERYKKEALKRNFNNEVISITSHYLQNVMINDKDQNIFQEQNMNYDY